MSQDVSGNRNMSLQLAAHSGIPHMRYYCIFLLIAFSISFLGNYCHTIVIIIERNHQTTKHTAVFNLSLTDIFESMAVIPLQLGAVLFSNCLILYGLCMYMLFVSLQSLTLTIKSFDRLAAMRFPLRINVNVTHRSLLATVCASWTLELIQTFFTNRLSFWRTSVPNVTNALFQVIIMFPGFCIAFSYTCRVLTMFRIKNPTRSSKSNEDMYFSFKISGCTYVSN